LILLGNQARNGVVFSERYIALRAAAVLGEKEREEGCDVETLIPNAPVQSATEQRALDTVAAAVAAPVAEAPPRAV